MAFLAPAFLALAALAGVPLLVHLLRRRVGRVLDFPAVRYLERMEQEHSRDLKLRNRLLLILRLIAVIALALAAARPIARLLGVGHAPIAVAIVMDNSLSTGVVQDGRMLFDSLRADAQRVIDDLTTDDRAWLVTADGRVIGGSPTTLQAGLEALRPLGGRGDLAAATRRAVGLARSGAPRTPVVAIVSDGQRSSFRADSVVNAAEVPVVMLRRGASLPRNRAVVQATAEPVRWTPGGTVTLAVTAPDSAAWRVTLDGRTVARGTAAPATLDAPTRVSQKLASASNGWLRGSVELDADALRADDTRWFAVRVAPPPTVNVRGEGGPFLSAALSTLVDEGRLARATAGESRAVTVSAAEAAATRLPVLLTAPRDPIAVGEANRQLERLGIPWRFGAIARSQVLARVPSRGGATDTGSVSAKAFDGTPVRMRYPLAYSPGGAAAGPKPIPDTIATAGGAPWVVAGDGYVLVGSPIDPEATDLPLDAAFVPWLMEALARRLGDDGRLIEASPGQAVSGLRDVTGLESPDGTVAPLGGDRLTVPSQAGVYFLRRQEARVGALVVNGESSESELGTAAADSASAAATLAGLVAGRDVVTSNDGSAWRQAVFSRAAGQALMLPLLVLALAALLAEAYVSNR
ncbi:VWA domain-containing protein [Gemmatimonas sp.]|uniref:VWA domain-containing protein n=1 Tax=Gemmatimonas sp. TaxID=1962908 RepID=UPI0027B9278A|nr:VWA domain-containing protein [Gemmatimonas sp.]